jgi:hypothetical protein
VREFLKENAEAWRKVNAEAREKAHVVPNRRHIKHSS